jgi:hypothetical protein
MISIVLATVVLTGGPSGEIECRTPQPPKSNSCFLRPEDDSNHIICLEHCPKPGVEKPLS